MRVSIQQLTKVSAQWREDFIFCFFKEKKNYPSPFLFLVLPICEALKVQGMNIEDTSLFDLSNLRFVVSKSLQWGKFQNTLEKSFQQSCWFFSFFLKSHYASNMKYILSHVNEWWWNWGLAGYNLESRAKQNSSANNRICPKLSVPLWSWNNKKLIIKQQCSCSIQDCYWGWIF